jgi:hypothetical protein
MKGENTRTIIVLLFSIQNLFDYTKEILRLYNLPFFVTIKTTFHIIFKQVL